jgi:uncharacterized protein (DUF885 family)
LNEAGDVSDGARRGRRDDEVEAAGAALAALAAEAWDRAAEASPINATSLGDRRFDDRMPDNAPGAADRHRATLAALQTRLAAIDPATLSDADRITRAALADVLGHERDLVDSGLAEWEVNPLDGPQVLFLNIASFQPVRTREEGDRLLRRWREMGPWVDRQIASSRAALADGIGAPAAAIRPVIAEIDALLARPIQHLPLLDPGRSLPADWSPADAQRFLSELADSVRESTLPAFARFRAFLADELLPVARGDERPGLVSVPGGLAAYRRAARAHTTLDLDPETVHETGLAETARIDAEFVELGGRSFGLSNRAAILDRLRSDPILHFTTSAEVFAVAEASLARANEAIPDWFGRRPHARCVVVEMGPHEAAHSTIAYYLQSAADGSRPGSYYINTTAPETRPRYEAETLAFHEAVPGHHLQIAIAQELEGLPTFRRMTGPTAFIEGWGLYSERLSAEMGLLSGELDWFGILSFDAWRACRLVVDTGLHALGWSRDEAIRFMTEHTALAENNVANEVDRYIAWPGQALAYKLGQLEILRLRGEAQTRLGPAFDIRAFHDAILGEGAVGLQTLRIAMDRWLAKHATDGRPTTR